MEATYFPQGRDNATTASGAYKYPESHTVTLEINPLPTYLPPSLTSNLILIEKQKLIIIKRKEKVDGKHSSETDGVWLLLLNKAIAQSFATLPTD